ncbi:hypothetical protein GTC6_15289 [Gordonia terrae C-6]|uniref:Uncharacterized protein n=1 Tax=Gordonia terrae C-6 TaxID=1316928 RepID=R7Y7H7_9ACTN|nr:hypothetical protein [Gordonia terrae]EON31986.1 hypothetical protein GTC6_15289 [Gordonia terrae C-6]
MSDIHNLMAELSRVSGLTFELSPWSIDHEQLWYADSPDGHLVILAPIRAAIVIQYPDGAAYFTAPTANIRDVSETIAFGLLAVQLSTPTPTRLQRFLARLRGCQRHS